VSQPSLEDLIAKAVEKGLQEALRPYLRRLADPEALVYTVPQAAVVLSTSTNTIRRMIDAGVLPILPNMGKRVLIPRIAIERLVDEAAAQG
jgi:excisionase family DNA binding protein